MSAPGFKPGPGGGGGDEGDDDGDSDGGFTPPPPEGTGGDDFVTDPGEIDITPRDEVDSGDRSDGSGGGGGGSGGGGTGGGGSGGGGGDDFTPPPPEGTGADDVVTQPPEIESPPPRDPGRTSPPSRSEVRRLPRPDRRGSPDLSSRERRLIEEEIESLPRVRRGVLDREDIRVRNVERSDGSFAFELALAESGRRALIARRVRRGEVTESEVEEFDPERDITAIGEGAFEARVGTATGTETVGVFTTEAGRRRLQERAEERAEQRAREEVTSELTELGLERGEDFTLSRDGDEITARLTESGQRELQEGQREFGMAVGAGGREVMRVSPTTAQQQFGVAVGAGETELGQRTIISFQESDDRPGEAPGSLADAETSEQTARRRARQSIQEQVASEREGVSPDEVVVTNLEREGDTFRGDISIEEADEIGDVAILVRGSPDEEHRRLETVLDEASDRFEDLTDPVVEAAPNISQFVLAERAGAEARRTLFDGDGDREVDLDRIRTGEGLTPGPVETISREGARSVQGFANLPSTARGLKEIGEVGVFLARRTEVEAEPAAGPPAGIGQGLMGAPAAATGQGPTEFDDATGGLDVRVREGERLEEAAEERIAAFESAAARDPAGTTAAVGTSLLISAGAIGGAFAASPRLGRATAGAIQPAEELATAGATATLGQTARGRAILSKFPGGRLDQEEIAIREARRAARGISRTFRSPEGQVGPRFLSGPVPVSPRAEIERQRERPPRREPRRRITEEDLGPTFREVESELEREELRFRQETFGRTELGRLASLATEESVDVGRTTPVSEVTAAETVMEVERRQVADRAAERPAEISRPDMLERLGLAVDQRTAISSRQRLELRQEIEQEQETEIEALESRFETLFDTGRRPPEGRPDGRPGAAAGPIDRFFFTPLAGAVTGEPFTGQQASRERIETNGLSELIGATGSDRSERSGSDTGSVLEGAASNLRGLL